MESRLAVLGIDSQRLFEGADAFAFRPTAKRIVMVEEVAEAEPRVHVARPAGDAGAVEAFRLRVRTAANRLECYEQAPRIRRERCPITGGLFRGGVRERILRRPAARGTESVVRQRERAVLADGLLKRLERRGVASTANGLFALEEGAQRGHGGRRASRESNEIVR